MAESLCRLSGSLLPVITLDLSHLCKHGSLEIFHTQSKDYQSSQPCSSLLGNLYLQQRVLLLSDIAFVYKIWLRESRTKNGMRFKLEVPLGTTAIVAA